MRIFPTKMRSKMSFIIKAMSFLRAKVMVLQDGELE